MRDRVKGTGPRMIFFEPGPDEGHPAAAWRCPPAEPAGGLPSPASPRYGVLPRDRGRSARCASGPAAGIFPVVYHDLVRWIHERGYRHHRHPCPATEVSG